MNMSMGSYFRQDSYIIQRFQKCGKKQLEERELVMERVKHLPH